MVRNESENINSFIENQLQFLEQDSLSSEGQSIADQSEIEIEMEEIKEDYVPSSGTEESKQSENFEIVMF